MTDAQSVTMVAARRSGHHASPTEGHPGHARSHKSSDRSRGREVERKTKGSISPPLQGRALNNGGRRSSHTRHANLHPDPINVNRPVLRWNGEGVPRNLAPALEAGEVPKDSVAKVPTGRGLGPQSQQERRPPLLSGSNRAAS